MQACGSSAALALGARSLPRVLDGRHTGAARLTAHTASVLMWCRARAQAAFGDALKGVEQVEAVSTSATAAAVDAHLDMLRPAITSYGATVQVGPSGLPVPEPVISSHADLRTCDNRCTQKIRAPAAGAQAKQRC